MPIPLKVLIIEDSEADALLLQRYLKKSGFQVTHRQVDNPRDFIAALEQEPWDVIISDFNLPRFSGLVALEMYQKMELNTPFIVVSGTIGEETAVQLVKAGAQDYIMKDNMTRLATAIERAIEDSRLRQERREALNKLRQSEARYRAVVEDQSEFINRYNLDRVYTFVNVAYARLHDTTPDQMIGHRMEEFIEEPSMEVMNSIHAVLTAENPSLTTETFFIRPDGSAQWLLWHDRLILDADGRPSEYQGVGHDITDRKLTETALRRSEEQLRKANMELGIAYDTTLAGWAKALELRDKETEGHSRNVTALTVRMAQQLGFSEGDLLHIRRGALLHDIGKMGIPDSILLKPGPLTPGEWAIMKRHPVYAYELLSAVDFLKPALDIPYYHHERWNGSGYPEKLKGTDIPLAARIFAVIDCWDALSSDRPYRKAWPAEKVITYLREQSGVLFDPEIVTAFLVMLSST